MHLNTTNNDTCLPTSFARSFRHIKPKREMSEMAFQGLLCGENSA